MVHHIGAEAAEAGLHLAAVGMLTQLARQAQQPEGILQAELLRLHALGQRRPLGLGILVAHLTTLHVGPVLTEQQINQIAGLRIFAQ